jgi:hypothetical protein
MIKFGIVVIRQAVGELRKRGIRVALTWSTGIGKTVFENLQACTLHKWADLEDSRHDNTELYHLIMTDKMYNKIKRGIQDPVKPIQSCTVVAEIPI